MCLGVVWGFAGVGGGRGGMLAARRGDLVVVKSYEGRLESRHTEVVVMPLAGTGVLIELAGEGTRVEAGEVLARFDDGQARREVLRLARDAELARLEVETLEGATLPLERDELSLRLDQAREEVEGEEKLLADFEGMARDGLVSEREVGIQAGRGERARRGVERVGREAEVA